MPRKPEPPPAVRTRAAPGVVIQPGTGNAQWMVTVRGRSERGTTPNQGTPAKTVAQAVLDRAAAEQRLLDGKRKAKRNNITVAEQVGIHITALEAGGERTDTTIDTYRNRLAYYVAPTDFGKMLMQDVEVEDCEQWITAAVSVRGRKLSRATMRDVSTLVSAAFDKAVKHGKLDANPMRYADRPAAPVIETRFAPEPAELAAIFAAYPAHYLIAAHAAYDGGVRRAELCGLVYDNIDWDAETLLIDRQWTGEQWKLPKEEKVRTVPVGAPLLQRIREHLIAQGGPGKGGVILAGRRGGGPLNPKQLDQKWRAMRLAHPEITMKGIHGLRHGFACGHNGEQPENVAYWMGDTLETIMRYYVHPERDARPKTASLADAAIRAGTASRKDRVIGAGDRLATVTDLRERRAAE
jgi:integrase